MATTKELKRQIKEEKERIKTENQLEKLKAMQETAITVPDASFTNINNRQQRAGSSMSIVAASKPNGAIVNYRYWNLFGWGWFSTIELIFLLIGVTMIINMLFFGFSNGKTDFVASSLTMVFKSGEFSGKIQSIYLIIAIISLVIAFDQYIRTTIFIIMVSVLFYGYGTMYEFNKGGFIANLLNPTESTSNSSSKKKPFLEKEGYIVATEARVFFEADHLKPSNKYIKRNKKVRIVGTPKNGFYNFMRKDSAGWIKTSAVEFR